ncbi:MAG: hypothetical protein WBA74_24110 [Cyclobacteriaceae bacterium]
MLVLITLSMLSSVPVMAQGAPPATPIDGGLSLLAAGAIVYGARKLHRHRKNK